MTVDEVREQLQKMKLVGKTEEDQQEADELLAAVMADITDADIQAEIDKQEKKTDE